MRLATNNNGSLLNWMVFVYSEMHRNGNEQCTTNNVEQTLKKVWSFGFAWPKSHFGPFGVDQQLWKKMKTKTRAYFFPFLACLLSLKVNSSSVGAKIANIFSSSTAGMNIMPKLKELACILTERAASIYSWICVSWAQASI